MSTTLSNLFTQSILTPLGQMNITATDIGLQKLEFSIENINEYPNDITRKSAIQIQQYFNQGRTEFDIPFDVIGTDFQKRVWTELCHLSYGHTATYMDMAIRLGDAKCIRAAGTANSRNPIAIIIPCHRVIGKDGSLTGYAGGLWRKKELLQLENALPLDLFSNQ
jgi:methylated-DNA-[protein]-cysteine S-methyltransferase